MEAYKCREGTDPHILSLEIDGGLCKGSYSGHITCLFNLMHNCCSILVQLQLVFWWWHHNKNPAVCAKHKLLTTPPDHLEVFLQLAHISQIVSFCYKLNQWSATFLTSFNAHNFAGTHFCGYSWLDLQMHIVFFLMNNSTSKLPIQSHISLHE